MIATVSPGRTSRLDVVQHRPAGVVAEGHVLDAHVPDEPASGRAPGRSSTSRRVSRISSTRRALPAAPWVVDGAYISVSSGP